MNYRNRAKTVKTYSKEVLCCTWMDLEVVDRKKHTLGVERMDLCGRSRHNRRYILHISAQSFVCEIASFDGVTFLTAECLDLP